MAQFKIGDRVELIKADTIPGYGPSVGAQGKVAPPSHMVGLDVVFVKFEAAFPGGHEGYGAVRKSDGSGYRRGFGWYCKADELKKIGASNECSAPISLVKAAPKIAVFEIGDYVEYTGEVDLVGEGDFVVKGWRGTVKGISSGYVAVEFERLKKGHSCGSFCQMGKGWWVLPRNLKLIAKGEPFQIGDCVTNKPDGKYGPISWPKKEGYKVCKVGPGWVQVIDSFGMRIEMKYKSSGLKLVEKARENKTAYCRTQKSQGVKALQDAFGKIVPLFSVHNAKDLAESALLCRLDSEKFARPCPVRPRHGFVDSRVVRTQLELHSLAKETYAADPEAEIILMPVLDAVCSAIWTPGSLTLGAGNDGATAGHEAVTVPVLGDIVDSYIQKKASIEHSPYLEIVYTNTSLENIKPWFVQLRDGPEVPSEPDYIPREIEVKAVAKAEGNLLEWEEKARHFEPGTVVWHPGGALSSHYAVHAILHGIPVLTSHEPQVGAVLRPTAGRKFAPNVESLRRGFKWALLEKKISYKEAAFFMLAALHNFAAWTGKYDELIGAGVGFAFRLALAACVGELRHKHVRAAGGKNRDKVYAKTWRNSFSKRGKIVTAAEAFLYEKWAHGFGGTSWFKIADAAIQLHNAVIEADYQKTIEKFNLLVNLAHNNGWAFNKFIGKDELDKAAVCAAWPAVFAGHWIYRLLRTEKLSKLGKHKRLEAPSIEIVEARVRFDLFGHMAYVDAKTLAGKQISSISYLTYINTTKIREFLVKSSLSGDAVHSLEKNSDGHWYFAGVKILAGDFLLEKKEEE